MARATLQPRNEKHAKPTSPPVTPARDALAWGLVVVAVLARPLAAAIPGMWLWGLNALRFLPAWTWGLWALSAVVLIPAVARRARRALAGAGDALRSPLVMPLPALGLAGLALWLADETRFVGDFLLRQGTVEESLSVARLFPQALPLDVWLHHSLPSWAAATLGIAPSTGARALGAVESALLAWLAVLFARRAGATREGLPAVAALVACGAWLALFTGYSKAFAEMTVLVVAAAVLGLDVLRGRRSPLLLSLAVSAGLLLHRSALGFLPAAGMAMLMKPAPGSVSAPAGKPTPGSSGSGVAVRPAVRLAVRLAALALPLAALALVAPRVAAGFRALDAPHFLGREGARDGLVAGLLSPLHLLDAANVTVFLVPLAILAVLALARRPAPSGLARREWAYLLVLAAPFAALLVLLHPAQGAPRDFDTFAASGVAVALVVGAAVADRLRLSPGAAALAPAILLATAAPTLEYLVMQADLDRGLARVEALVEGPPLRPAFERAKASEFLGSRCYRAGRPAEAVAHYARAVELGPSPNIVMGWGLVAGYARDRASEERAYRLLLEKASADQVEFRLIAYTRLATLALARGDARGARVFAGAALDLDPENEVAREVLARAGRANGSRGGKGADGAGIEP